MEPAVNQATFNITITDTTPGIIADLLARASDDPTSAATPATASNTVSGFTRPLLRKTLPIMVEAPVSRDQLPLAPLDSLQGACPGELGCPWSGSAGGRAAVGGLAEFAGEDGCGLRVPRPAGR